MNHRQSPKQRQMQRQMNRRQRNYRAESEASYAKYEMQYPRRGFIKTQTVTAQDTFPVKDVKVEILKELPEGIYVISSQMTDLSGLTEPVSVPVLSKEETLVPGIKEPFLTYDIRFAHPDFTEVYIRDVPVYEDLTTFQQVEMIPRSVNAVGGGDGVIEYAIRPPVV